MSRALLTMPKALLYVLRLSWIVVRVHFVEKDFFSSTSIYHYIHKWANVHTSIQL